MSAKYFSYTPDYNGFELHDTKEEARKMCNGAIEQHRDDSVDGWSEEVTSICWGVITEEAREGTREYHKDECDDEVCVDGCKIAGHPWDYAVDYGLARLAMEDSTND